MNPVITALAVSIIDAIKSTTTPEDANALRALLARLGSASYAHARAIEAKSISGHLERGYRAERDTEIGRACLELAERGGQIENAPNVFPEEG